MHQKFWNIMLMYKYKRMKSQSKKKKDTEAIINQSKRKTLQVNRSEMNPK